MAAVLKIIQLLQNETAHVCGEINTILWQDPILEEENWNGEYSENKRLFIKQDKK
jgi:hypothetical protein